jgi:hypothetical protein
MKNSKRVGQIALFLLALAAGSEFLLRGVLRIAVRGGDLASPYVSAQRLIHGRNPYSSNDFLVDWHASGGPANRSLDSSGIHPIYPPTALVVVSPLATISWPAAVRLYGWGCTFGYAVLVWLLGGTIDGRWTSERRLGFAAFAFGLSPIHAGISQGNLSIIVFLLCAYGLYLAWCRYEIVAGILLALGLCIKPTSAIAAIAVILLYGRMKAFLTAVGLSAIIASFSAIAISNVNSIWRVDYLKNLAVVFGPTGAASFVAPGGDFALINLQMPIYVICRDAKIANALAVAITVGLVMVWLFLFQRERQAGMDWSWLGAGSLLLIALLPVYQRNYNAEAVLFAAMWAFGNLRIRNAGARVAVLIGFVFLVPGVAILGTMKLPAQLWSNVLWKSLIMPQLTWAIVASIGLCYFYRFKDIRLAEAANSTASSEPLS